MPIGLYALALAAFGIGLTEFGVVGLLPSIANDLSINEQLAGYLVSGYALSVAIGALFLTALMAKIHPRRALIVLTLLFIVGNGVSALASNYQWLLAGRILAALCHGAFFSIGAVVASELVAENKKAAAIALMFAGLTVSNVIGVPLGTLVGLDYGWRMTFGCLGVIGMITALGIRILIPDITPKNHVNLVAEIHIFKSTQVWLSLLMSIFSFASIVGGLTYIAFTLIEVSGFDERSVPWLLILFGLGTFIGNIYGGKAADKSIGLTLGTLFFSLIIILLCFAFYAQSKIVAAIMLMLMGIFGLATAPGLQLRMMQYAANAPTLASGANIAAFNIGNALGAWLGGIAIGRGYGFTAPLWIGAVLSLCALTLLIVSSVVRDKAPRPILDV